MLGFLLSALSGFLMSIQGVFNTRLQDKTGLWEAVFYVQLTGFILSGILLALFHKGNFSRIFSINPLYLTGGVIGVFITITVVKGISSLGPALAISAILIAQLITASAIDFCGLFGTDKTYFSITKAAGILMMLAGIWVLKFH